MKNKVKLKKFIILLTLVTSIILSLFFLIDKYEYYVYKKNFDTKINSILLKIKEDYPSITDEEIYNILMSQNDEKIALEEYSLTLDNTSLIKLNDQEHLKFQVLNLSLLLLSIILLIYLFLRFNAKKDKEINSITKYLEAINHMNYHLSIDDITEDELSILKNELYKVTIKLKEDAENSKKDKNNLKTTLADISHQLKTPITSVLIILDNLIDNPDMDITTREDFLRDIKRELININFLVLNLLKLSRLDSNTVHFFKKQVSLEELVSESLKRVEVLCDLKNIKIDKSLAKDITIFGDANWQVEAITNILKNSIEHSKDNSTLIITTKTNKVYASIEIQDFGSGITPKDLPHIFERFYKGEGSSSDSIGIGLSLAKKIIESNNGLIMVDASKKGTTFTIKYFY